MQKRAFSVLFSPKPAKQVHRHPKVQKWWNNQTEEKIYNIFGDEWEAGNLSYHLKDRPRWLGTNYDRLGPFKSNYKYNDIVICGGEYHLIGTVRIPKLCIKYDRK